jgi:hypothetical protein
VVLVSFLLVLAAAVTLVIGLLNSGLGLIYVSIGCSVAAGIVLALAVVRSRPERAAAPAVGSERLRALEEEEAPTVTVVPTRGGKRRAAEQAPAAEEEEDAAVGASDDGEGVFPIADYDDLKVGEIVSLLPELDEDELEMVREREEGGKNRSTILTRVEALTGAEAAAASSGGGDWGVSERHWDAWDDEGAEEEEEPEEEEEFAGDEAIFPIADYDELKAAEVVSLLPELDDDELEEVRDREERGAARATVLNRIDQLLGVEPEPVKKAPARKKAATKKAPAKKKAAAKKAPAKKAAAKKTTAKKTTAKKSTAKKSTAKRAAKRS